MKTKNIDSCNTTNKYPRLLNTAPIGQDWFEGESQNRIADTISCYITNTDAQGDYPIARIIGLEGKWGSGKSNVISILQKKLSDRYIVFDYDAWGNQEDLQRRSILERLTHSLIYDHKVLTGKTKISVLKPNSNGVLSERECGWEEKLQSLLSRKSYTRNVTIPSVNNWTKWFVFFLLLTGLIIPFADVVLADLHLAWWMLLLLILSPITVFILVALCCGKLGIMWKMYNTEDKSDTTSYVISEQEPSVQEFKNWMSEISVSIPKEKRLIIVFDNMDRLSSEKVKQLWSSINTFFADGGYSNIWCIVPYDELHLANAFGGNLEEGKDSLESLRGFLKKTFPVVYRIPDPIITDYKGIVSRFINEAFNDSIEDSTKERINRIYRSSYPNPNVRAILSFINQMVSYVNARGGEVSYESIAIYLAKEDELLGRKRIVDGNGNVETTESYIINREYETPYRLLLSDIDRDRLQKDIAAVLYGVSPDDAQQLVIKRYIENSFVEYDNVNALTNLVSEKHFINLLEDVVYDVEEDYYSNAIPQIDKIDVSSLTKDDNNKLSQLWNYLGKKYVDTNFLARDFGDFEKALFSHLEGGLLKQCLTAFYRRLSNDKDVEGKEIFNQLNALFSSECTKETRIKDICSDIEISPERFLSYLKRAGINYKKYPLLSDSNKLNSYLISKFDGEFPFTRELLLLKEDEKYNVKEVGEFAVRKLNEASVDAATASVLIGVQRVFYGKFQNSDLDHDYITTLWNEALAHPQSLYYDEIYALKALSSYQSLPLSDKESSALKEKYLFYKTTSQVLDDSLSFNFSYIRSLAKIIIEEKIHDSHPDYNGFVHKWENIIRFIGVSRHSIIDFADDWGYTSLSDEDSTLPIRTLFPEPEAIKDLLDTQSPLAIALIKKAVHELEEQNEGAFIQHNPLRHTGQYWDTVLSYLAGTTYIKVGGENVLRLLVVRLLDYVARAGSVFKETDSLMILKEKCPYELISSDVIEIRDKILNGQTDYRMTPVKFLLLHDWLEKAEIDAPSHRTDTANRILSQVIEDEQCQRLIVEKGDYYKPIITETLESSSNLHKCIRTIMEKSPESEIALFLKSVITLQS